MANGNESIRARHGARSCIECRRRKIRCIWPQDGIKNGAASDARSACERCSTRGFTCIPQLVRPSRQNRVSAVHLTADDRLGHLERELSSLTTLLRERQDFPSPNAGHVAGLAWSSDAGLKDELYLGNIEGSRPPYHLRILFEDFGIYSTDPKDVDTNAPSDRNFRKVVNATRGKMQRLLPSREEIEQLTGFAPDWMALYHTLFPAFFTFRTGQHLIINYDRMNDPEVDLIVLAMYLLSVAITMQQICPESPTSTFFRGQGVASFVDVVCQVVGQTVIENDILVGTVQGIETAMLYFRLLLGRGNLKKTWLMLRRIIALAEMAGLPQAQHDANRNVESSSQAQPMASNTETMELKATVWEAICATDRNFSMMMNLPAGTFRYSFPREQLVIRDDRVSSQAYNYQLSAICGIVFEIDELYMRGVHDSEAYEKVLGADRKLRALAASVPRAWWLEIERGPLADLLVKFWHNYIAARVHLRPAVMSNSDEQYAYSRATCWEACKDALQRFVKFRSSIPSGFFVCRILDVQAFTAASFLLLSSKSHVLSLQSSWLNAPSDPQVTELVRELTGCFRLVCDKAGSEFAREAIIALETLESHVQGNNLGQSLSLQIPLLGRVSINGVSDETDNTGLTSSREESELGASSGLENARAENFGTDVRLQSSVPDPTDLSGTAAPLSWTIEFGNAALWTDASFSMDSFNAPSSLNDWY